MQESKFVGYRVLCMRIAVLSLVWCTQLYFIPEFDFFGRSHWRGHWILFAVPYAFALPAMIQFGRWQDRQTYSPVVNHVLFLLGACGIAFFSRIMFPVHFALVCVALMFLSRRRAVSTKPNWFTQKMGKTQWYFIGRLTAYSFIWFAVWIGVVRPAINQSCHEGLCRAVGDVIGLLLYPLIILFLLWVDRALRKRGVEIWQSAIAVLVVELLLLWQYKYVAYIVIIPLVYFMTGKVEFK